MQALAGHYKAQYKFTFFYNTVTMMTETYDNHDDELQWSVIILN